MNVKMKYDNRRKKKNFIAIHVIFVAVMPAER
jgi:hypothetical protein